MKNILFISFSILFCITSNAQSFQIKDLSSSLGNWKGELTYLDYTSANPFTMLANFKISFTVNKSGYTIGYDYPKEPHANSIDTIYVIGNFFGKDKIVEFKKEANGDFKLVTEIAGEDGNDHKKAALRHTYLLKTNTYSIVKEVKFDGTDKWIKRNQYILKRVEN